MTTKQQPQIHTYHGSTYLPCSRVDSTSEGLRWYRVVTHPGTGMDWDEQYSPKFRTLRECRADAEEVLRQASDARTG